MAQVQIFFGSQSGTAECFSEMIADEAKEKGMTAEVIDLEAFTPESFAACKIAILVVATYGDGEPSDNAFKFHKWVTDPRNKGALKGQRFTVMGLGDMNYSKFNNMGQTTDIGMDLLGSERIYKRGVGDDSQDIEADFRKWKDNGLWDALKKAISCVMAEGGFPAPAAKAAEAEKPTFAPPSRKTKILCAGGEAKEASEALADQWPGGNTAVEDASLSALAAAAAAKEQVVIAVECAGDGGLSDEARGLATQLGSAPMAVKAQLRALRFALVAVAATEYGNAGERASANAMRSEITRAVAPVTQALSKIGAGCVATTSLDLQDADENRLKNICSEFQKGFQEGAQDASKAALPVGTPALKIADSIAQLPQECQGEPAEVLARFYFEADKAKVTKVRELRQKPDPEKGLATAEIEIEATGDLKNYTLGGTLSLLPENDPADVEACLTLLGLKSSDASKAITFLAAEGNSAKVKRPFPTPCTIGEALSKYCDLARAPTKKMLQSMQPKLKDAAAEHVARLLADADALKLLQEKHLCCRMHEFWKMLGVTSLDLQEFLLHCPRQKAREFTIASSPKAAPAKITLCVSLTSHGLEDGGKVLEQLRDAGCIPKEASLACDESRRFFGLCSRWITTKLKAGTEVLAKHRPSPFHLPEKDVPVVMVGSGAGVAPFKGFWDELRREASKQAPAALFFGCRHPEQDWLFKEEMSGAVKLATNPCAALARVQVGPKRPLTMLHTAFSRPGEGKESVYVQKKIVEQKMSVKHWVEKMSGCVFICGSTAMGNGVLEALAEILEGGKDTVEQLRKDGRIVAEMWG